MLPTAPRARRLRCARRFQGRCPSGSTSFHGPHFAGSAVFTSHDCGPVSRPKRGTEGAEAGAMGAQYGAVEESGGVRNAAKLNTTGLVCPHACCALCACLLPCLTPALGSLCVHGVLARHMSLLSGSVIYAPVLQDGSGADGGGRRAGRRGEGGGGCGGERGWEGGRGGRRRVPAVAMSCPI
jgi:hypothetical protein